MKKWFALYVKPKHEKVVEQELLRGNYEAYLPLTKSLRQWSDRKKMVEMPLIPSYVFARIKESDMYDILRFKGCLRFVWFNNKPCPIPDNQIDSMKLLQAKELEIELENDIRPSRGDRIRIIDGPFEGLVGVVKNGNKKNFAVRIDSLRLDLSIVLDENYIKLAEKLEE